MLQNRVVRSLLLSFFAILTAYAKDPPLQVIVWPESGTPILRFTFGKFKEVGALGSQRSYVTETTAENLWSKPISNANFSLYLYDKNRTRIAEATPQREQRRFGRSG
jgi:hypothetical protein